ncbi:unnamed protein product, partial [Tetraodon nigroviridis]
MAAQPPTITTVLLFLPLLAQGQFDVCRSLRDSEGGPGWEFYACQPSPSNMKEVMQIRVDPPGITCGNPPERFCTLENPYLCSDECDASSPDLSHPPQLMGDRERGGLITYWQSVTWSRYPEPLLANITLSWNKSLELVDDITLTFEYGRATSMVLEKSLDKVPTPLGITTACVTCYTTFTSSVSATSSSDSTDTAISGIYTTNEIIGTTRLNDNTATSTGAPTTAAIPELNPRSDGPPCNLAADCAFTAGNERTFSSDIPITMLPPDVSITAELVSLPDISLEVSYASTPLPDIPCSGVSLTVPSSNISPPREGQLKLPLPDVPFFDETLPNKFLPDIIPPPDSPLITLSPTQNCECNDHSSRCSYIDFINVVTCVSCKHNTRGQRCQYCRLGFYRNASLPLNDENVCAVCDCDEERSVSPHCSDDGACQCKPGASGRRCDSCLPGYTWRANGSGCTGDLLLCFYNYGSGLFLMKTKKSILSHIVSSEKVCDEESLMCQNGGTCIDFQRCICPDKFTGAQ